MINVRMNFKEILGDWEPVLRDRLLKSAYMDNLMKFLETEYANKKIQPAKKDVFRAFRTTPYKDVRVVVIGQDPYPSKRASGLAFGNDPEVCGAKLSPSLEKMRDGIERTVYDGFQLHFDPSMLSWAQQGVLMLNSSLSVVEGFPGTHTKYWNRFMRNFVNHLSNNKTGLCYLLLGANASLMEQHINTSCNYVFKYAHPSYAARNETEWNCPYFKKINELIEHQNGEEYCIKW